jgi:hypothetical protein
MGGVTSGHECLLPREKLLTVKREKPQHHHPDSKDEFGYCILSQTNCQHVGIA